MVNYSNSIIYKLCCKNPDITEIYIGSTTNKYRRKNCHKSNCNNVNGKDYNYYVYQFIRNNGGFENWDFVEIESYQAINKGDLHKREREWIEELKSDLNQNIPTRTDKEYRESNKDVITERKKKYYEENKDEKLSKSKEYYEAHKDKKLRKSKEYYEANKDKIKARQTTNNERIKQYQNKYREVNKEKRKEYQKRYREGKIIQVFNQSIVKSTDYVK